LYANQRQLETTRNKAVSPGSLHTAFPNEVAQLSGRYQAFKRQSFLAKRSAAADLIRGTAYTLHEQGQYPSVRKLLNGVGWKRTREDDVFVRGVLTAVRNELGLSK